MIGHRSVVARNRRDLNATLFPNTSFLVPLSLEITYLHRIALKYRTREIYRYKQNHYCPVKVDK